MDILFGSRWKRVLIMCALIIFGFILRSYNLDFPSIGYHNMQENEYLSMAQVMRDSGDYLAKRVYFSDAFTPDPKVKFTPQPPLVAYQILLAWQLLGTNLWGPRLFNAVFGVASIPVLYAIAFLIFSSFPLAFFCASLLAIMPLAVFFSRNLQPDGPALFFMLLGNLMYLRYMVSRKSGNLLWGGLSISVAWLYKLHFLFGVVPAIFFLPWRDWSKDKGQLKKCAAFFLAPYLGIMLYLAWLSYRGLWEVRYPDVHSLAALFAIFSSSFWQGAWVSVWSYLQDNFTVVFTILSIFGMILALLTRSTLVNRYLLGWVITLLLYAMVFSEEFRQQNYAQMPFLGMVCIAVAYVVFFISETVQKNFRKNLFALFAIIIFGASAPFVYASTQRMYMTMFPGADVAGGSLKEFAKPGERVFLFTHAQGYAIGRYAQRYMGWPKTFEEFKKQESDYKVRYICIYPVDFLGNLRRDKPEFFEYIQSNYHLKELGLIEESQQLVYVILEKGVGQDLSKFLENFSGKLQSRAIYHLFGRFIFFHTVRPALPEKAAPRL